MSGYEPTSPQRPSLSPRIERDSAVVSWVSGGAGAGTTPPPAPTFSVLFLPWRPTIKAPGNRYGDSYRTQNEWIVGRCGRCAR